MNDAVARLFYRRPTEHLDFSPNLDIYQFPPICPITQQLPPGDGQIMHASLTRHLKPDIRLLLMLHHNAALHSEKSVNCPLPHTCAQLVSVALIDRERTTLAVPPLAKTPRHGCLRYCSPDIRSNAFSDAPS